MSKYSIVKLITSAYLAVALAACVTEGGSESDANAQSAGLLLQERSIDWDRATQDARLAVEPRQKRAAGSESVVPLLLPPLTLRVSDIVAILEFSEPKVLTDQKGYSAVVSTDGFDMLVDASNQMLRTEDAAIEIYPQDFDGKIQSVGNGLQLTIGRYGALYAIQFICTNGSSDNCVSENTAQEIVQALQVQLP